MSDTWTIGELAEHAADALRDHAHPFNGRVREVPGERLIRWYTTIGLVDPPLTRRGRIALYGRRHLLQLVAVKRLQAEGMSIARIQVTLAGATDATLEATARLPGPAAARRPEANSGAGRPAPRRPRATTNTRQPPPGSPQDTRTDRQKDPGTPHNTRADRQKFADPGTPQDTRAGRPNVTDPGTSPDTRTGPLNVADPGTPPGSSMRGPAAGGRGDAAAPSSGAAPPQALAAGSLFGEDGNSAVRTRFWADRAAQEADRPVQEKVTGAVHGVRLADGVVLMLDGMGRAPGDDDVRAVLAAAGPLLAVLEERGLR